MATTIKSSAEFQTIINQAKPVLLDFYADWCGPCQMLLPVVDELSNKYPDQVEVVKINVDDHPGIAQEYGVRSIPALFFVQGGAIQSQMVGYQSLAVLENKLQALAVNA